MITNNQILRLSKFKSASFAIWSNEFPSKGCLERNDRSVEPNLFKNFFLTKRRTIKESIVFVGLNRSVKSKKGTKFVSFANFHRPGTVKNRSNDFVLKMFIQDKNLTSLMGGYMTDLNGRKEEKKSKKVKVSVKDIQDFWKQLKILNKRNINVLCFGDLVFRNLNMGNNPKQVKTIGPTRYDIKYNERKFGTITLKLFRIWHYAHWGKRNHLKKQLNFLNKYLSAK